MDGYEVIEHVRTREQALAHLKSEGLELPDSLTDLEILGEACDWGYAYHNFRPDLWRMGRRQQDTGPREGNTTG